MQLNTLNNAFQTNPLPVRITLASFDLWNYEAKSTFSVLPSALLSRAISSRRMTR
jgi:hypothetical protein